ncbi:hypothetical protein HOLleu_08315 [Holothuria leucospilota]|uniref:Uncharacterized protein n=1 Tax=Holothuria leucospilota TaxID=206669 RepID=A0A9Q1CHD0_HOLLE|nr:hypothetical protein HOLleu_08315 [Holothuria leucospilota]
MMSSETAGLKMYTKFKTHDFSSSQCKSKLTGLRRQNRFPLKIKGKAKSKC